MGGAGVGVLGPGGISGEPGTAPHQPLARLRATAPSVTASPQAATSIPRKGEDLGFLPRPPSESRRPATPARHRPGAPAGRAARHAGPRRWGVLLPERGLPRGTLPEQGPDLRKLEVPGGARVPGPGQARTEGRGVQRPEAPAEPASGLDAGLGLGARLKVGDAAGASAAPAWPSPGADGAGHGLRPPGQLGHTLSSGRRGPAPADQAPGHDRVKWQTARPHPSPTPQELPAGLAGAGCPTLGTLGRAELRALHGQAGQVTVR